MISEQATVFGYRVILVDGQMDVDAVDAQVIDPLNLYA
jgi:hypothetical protein